MNQAHFHLIINHFPIIFPIAGIIVLTTGFIFQSEIVKRTAFLLFILAAITSVLAMISGENAENFVENIPEINEIYIEKHEKSAKIFSILTYLLGLFALLGLWLSVKQKKYSNMISIAILVLGLITLYFGKETGTTGGEIRHTEIRNSNTTIFKKHKKTKIDDD